jgi:transposase-like protein
MQCVHCGSNTFVKNGSKNKVQQYKCKQCGRSFSDKPRKFTYADKERFLDLHLNNVGIRKSARFIGCSPSMPVRWVRELATNLRNQLRNASVSIDTKIPDIIEMDEIYTRVKKGATESQYGLLIVGGEVRLLRIPLEKRAGEP